MTPADINFSARGGVAVASLNRPECLNALREQTFRELHEILEETASSDSIWVLVFTGAGRAFSSGKDLKEINPEHVGAGVAEPESELKRLQEITRRMHSHPSVLIAAVNGLAVGFGAELSLNCDIRLAAHTASFAFVEPMRGLFPTNAAHFILPRLIGQGRAAEMLLTGNTVRAVEAAEWGLVNRVFSDEQLMDATLQIANRIAANAPLSVRQSLRLLRESSHSTLEEVLISEMEATMRCLQSSDVLEGARAFFEKRPPVFKGE